MYRILWKVDSAKNNLSFCWSYAIPDGLANSALIAKSPSAPVLDVENTDLLVR